MACSSTSFSLLDLPSELLVQVLSHLHQPDGLRAAAACRLLRQVAGDINRKAGWRPKILVALSGQARILDVSSLLFSWLPEPLPSAAHPAPRRSKSVTLQTPRKKGSPWFTSITVPKEQPRTLYVCQYRVRGIIQFELLPRLRYQRQTATDTLLQEPEGVVVKNNFLYVQTNWGVLNRCFLDGAVIEHRFCGVELVTWCLVEGPDGSLYCSADESYETRIYTEAPAATKGMVLRWQLKPTGALPDMAEPFTKARIKRPCGLNFGSSCGTLFVTSMDGCVYRFAGPQQDNPGSLLSVIQLTPQLSTIHMPPGFAGGAPTVHQPWQEHDGKGPVLPSNVLPWDVLVVKGNTLVISMHKNSAYTRAKKAVSGQQGKQPSTAPLLPTSQGPMTRRRARQQQEQEEEQRRQQQADTSGQQQDLVGGQQQQQQRRRQRHDGIGEEQEEGVRGQRAEHGGADDPGGHLGSTSNGLPQGSEGTSSSSSSSSNDGSFSGSDDDTGASSRQVPAEPISQECRGVSPEEACYLVMVGDLGAGPMRVIRLPDWVDHASCMCAADQYQGQSPAMH